MQRAGPDGLVGGWNDHPTRSPGVSRPGRRRATSRSRIPARN